MSAGKPKVSVCVVTYNQEAYIAECLQSLVDQETDFAFEILVADDCSTDNTRAIVTEFARRYPDKVIAVLNEHNLGVTANYRSVHRMARGLYVAHLDGDDYVLPGKLTEQARILDSMPDITAVFHPLKMINADGTLTGKLWPESAPSKIDVSFLLTHHPIFGHSSMMYRSGLLDDFLALDDEIVDFMVYTHLAVQGPLYLLKTPFGAYRLGVGISRENYKWLDKVLAVFSFAEARGISGKITARGRANQYFQAAHNALYLRNYKVFRDSIEKSVRAAPFSSVQKTMFYLRRTPNILLLLHHAYVKARALHLLPNVKRKFSPGRETGKGAHAARSDYLGKT